MNVLVKFCSFNFLQMAIKLLMSTTNWEKVQNQVTSFESSSLTGDEKRLVVREKLMEMLNETPKWILNLAIEIAVAKLRNKAA